MRSPQIATVWVENAQHLVAPERRGCTQQDLQIKPWRHVLDIVQIEIDTSAHLLIGPSAYLPPSRQPGPYSQTRTLPLGVAVDQEGLLRTRPYPAHLAAHN